MTTMYRSSVTWLCVFSCMVVLRTHAQQPCRPFERSMDNLREVIIGRCTLYQRNVNQPVFCDEGFRNCTEVWEKFSSAFKFQPRCNVSYERYDDYIRVTNHTIPVDKSLFWENVYPFVHRLSNKGAKYTTLSDTLTGYIGNAANWCSDETTVDGMAPLGTICPGWEPTPDCQQSANRAFWMAASNHFASSARGGISILLNSSGVPIFATSTYLAVYELPLLKPNVVTKATVLLLNEHPVKGTTKCDDPSLKIMAKMMDDKNITYDCIENQRDVAALFCLDFPSSKMCPISDAVNAGNRTGVFVLANNLILFIVLAVGRIYNSF